MQNPASFINSSLPTPAAVIDALNGKSGGLTRSAGAYLLHNDLTPWVLSAPPAGSVAPNDISAFVDGQPTVEMNTADEVQRKFKLAMREFAGIEQINPIADLIQITDRLYKNGRIVFENPVGTFVMTIADRTLADSGNVRDVSGTDRAQRVADIGISNTIVIPSGFGVVTAVEALLMMDKLPPSQGGRQPVNAPNLLGGCVGCLPAGGTGTGAGYCPLGYSVTDLQSGCIAVTIGGTTRYSRSATGFSGTISYAGGIGQKLDAGSGAVIDPFSCTPMTVATIVPPSPNSGATPGEMSPGYMVPGGATSSVGSGAPHFLASRRTAAGNQMWYDQSTGLFYDVATGEQVDPETGKPATITTVTIFTSLGGDGTATSGGVTTIPVATGNGAGYCPSIGYAIADPLSGMTPVAPGSVWYSGPVIASLGHVVQLNSTVGLKVANGYPIDPWTCKTMQPAPNLNPYGDAFVTSKTYNAHPVWFLAAGSYFIDSVTGAPIDPTTGNPALATPTGVFVALGGDGGIAPLLGQAGPNTTGGFVGAYKWPDLINNPCLAPSGCELACGPNIPASQILIEASPLLTTTTMSFDPKTPSLLTAINQLLSSINYWPLYTDNLGRFRSGPMTAITGAAPVKSWLYTTAIDWTYAGVPNSPLGPIAQLKILDQKSIANVVVVRSENNKAAPIVAVAYNRSTKSYLSIDALGYAKMRLPVIQLDSITDITLLQSRALIELLFAALGSESIDFEVLINSLFDTHDILGINIWSPDGTTLEVDSTTNPFLVSAWSFDFGTGLAKVTAGRLIPL